MEGRLEATTAWQLGDVGTAADALHPLLTSGLFWKTQWSPSCPATGEVTEGMGTATGMEAATGGADAAASTSEREAGGAEGMETPTSSDGMEAGTGGADAAAFTSKREAGGAVGVMETAVSTGGGAPPPTRLVRSPWRVWRSPSSVLAVFTAPRGPASRRHYYCSGVVT